MLVEICIVWSTWTLLFSSRIVVAIDVVPLIAAADVAAAVPLDCASALVVAASLQTTSLLTPASRLIVLQLLLLLLSLLLLQVAVAAALLLISLLLGRRIFYGDSLVCCFGTRCC